MRPEFLAADVGITGANFLVAETGSSIIVTNEGNGDLTQILPRIHIVVTSIEKVVPTLEDAATLLRLLARSATGQEFSSYTTLSTGPRRPGDVDGPEQYHVVLLDNGRTDLLGGEFQDMLRCLRCCGLPQPLSGLCRGRRARLWLGLSRADGGGADPGIGRAARGRASAERLDVLRPMRERLPGQDPAAEDDAALARARVRPPAEPADLPLGSAAVGLAGGAARAVPRLRQHREPHARHGGQRARPLPPPAARRAAGRRCATCRRPRAAAFRACGPNGSGRMGPGLAGHERARRHTRRHPPGAAARAAAGRNPRGAGRARCRSIAAT